MGSAGEEGAWRRKVLMTLVSTQHTVVGPKEVQGAGVRDTLHSVPFTCC